MSLIENAPAFWYIAMSPALFMPKLHVSGGNDYQLLKEALYRHQNTSTRSIAIFPLPTLLSRFPPAVLLTMVCLSTTPGVVLHPNGLHRLPDRRTMDRPFPRRAGRRRAIIGIHQATPIGLATG